MIFGRKIQKRLQEQEATSQLDQQYWSIVRRQFKKNRVAVWSLRFLIFLFLIALFGDFIANEKPLYCKIDGKTYFPVLKQYAVDLGLDQWDAKFLTTPWKKQTYEAKIWAPIPYSYDTKDFANSSFAHPLRGQVVDSPHFWHRMGTDAVGRDVAAGMIAGTRTAMLVGIIAMTVATLIGLFLGAVAGFFGDDRLRISRARLFLNALALFLGLFFAFESRRYAFYGEHFNRELFLSLFLVLISLIVANLLAMLLKKIPFLGRKVLVPADLIIMRIIEVFRSIPNLLLILALVAAIDSPSILMIMVIIGFISWPGIALFTRAELLKVKNLQFIEAAQSMGFSRTRIILRHALPNALTPVLITIAFGIASAILLEAFLSYLGIGLSLEEVTWGSMLNSSRQYPQAWWLAIFPGLAIFLTVTIFNLIGEGLTDAMDPKLSNK